MSSLLVVLIVVLGLAAVFVGAWILWPKIGSWFRDSETLFIARLQLLVGAVWGVLIATDLTPFLNIAGLGEWVPVWVAFSGIVTEIARRARDPGLK